MTSTKTDATASATKQTKQKENRFYLAAWRWHFYAGLFTAPFFIVLAVTGIAMMTINFFDGRDGEKITVNIPENTTQLSLDTQGQIVLENIPNGKLVEWIRAVSPNHANVFRIKNAEGEQIMVAINPYNGDVLESWSRRQGWYDFADNIHSDLLIGTTGDRILEIAAGFGIVLLITGMYLWWPRDRSLKASLFANLRKKGRSFWKELHSLLGIYVSIFFLLFLLSGMAWTGIWGGKLVQAWNTFPAEKWNNVPLSDETHASMNHGAASDIPWALEQTPLPESGSAAGITGIKAGVAVNLDSVAALAQQIGFENRYRISIPQTQSAVWTINQDTMSADAQNPFSDRTVHIDQYSGKILANVSFNDYSLAGKAMAVSIPLHMGLVTVWNFLFNLVLCLSVITMSLTGIILWWKRRPSKTGFRLHAPKIPKDLPHWRSAMTIMLTVSLAFPLVGITLVSVLLLDWLLFSRISYLRRVTS